MNEGQRVTAYGGASPANRRQNQLQALEGRRQRSGLERHESGHRGRGRRLARMPAGSKLLLQRLPEQPGSPPWDLSTVAGKRFFRVLCGTNCNYHSGFGGHAVFCGVVFAAAGEPCVCKAVRAC